MKELQQKQKARNRLYSTPTLLILFILTILIIRGAFGVLIKQRESARLMIDLAIKENNLLVHEAELKANIERLKTDEGIDTEIKEKYSVSKPGEKVAIIVDEKSATTAAPTSTPAWYERLWKGIIGH